MYRSHTKFYKISIRELALLSILSSLWIAMQVTLGPVIGQITHVHGVVQRFFGWLLMQVVAELTNRFGRVTFMATTVALVTRIIRRSTSLYPWVLALGYALGGLVFDLLFFIPFFHDRRFKDTVKMAHVLLVSMLSGITALMPYIAFQFYTLDVYVFTIRLPTYIYALIKGISLNTFGTLVGASITPRIKNTMPLNIKTME